jgi:hypothetical protein
MKSRNVHTLGKINFLLRFSINENIFPPPPPLPVLPLQINRYEETVMDDSKVNY